MSASQWFAQMAVNGLVFPFARWETDSGHVPGVMQMIQEPLRAGGVDGVRYLDDHREPLVFTAQTWQDAPDVNAAYQLATSYELAQSLYAQLSVLVGTGIYTFSPIKVLHVAGIDGPRPHVRGGQLAGFGATPGYNAYVEALWTLHLQL